MKKLLSLLLVLAVLSPNAAAAEAAEPIQSTAKQAEYDGYLVKLDDAAPNAEKIVAETDGCETIADGVAVADEPRGLCQLIDQGVVDYVEPNYILDIQDTYTPTQWNMTGISAQSAWNHTDSAGNYDLRGDGVTVAVVDSGVYAGHSDLNAANILATDNLSGVTGGVDVYHGTFVAGILAAQLGSSSGVAGVDGITPNINILPICITSGGETNIAKLITAIDDAVSNGAQVVNLSVGSKSSSELLKEACQKATDAGLILVAAAGNYTSTSIKGSDNYLYPASYDDVVSVSACKQSGTSAVFDGSYSYFNDQVTVSAPGTLVTSLSIGSPTATKTGSGTSFAAPVVSAMAAIAKEKNPNINSETFMTLLQDSSTDLGAAGYDDYYGSGLVNVDAFIQALDQNYTISYESGNSAAQFASGTAAPAAYTVASDDLTLPIPVRDGYDFAGWYDNSALTGSAVTAIPSGSCGNRTFYAKWTEKTPTPVDPEPSGTTTVRTNADGSTTTTTTNDSTGVVTEVTKTVDGSAYTTVTTASGVTQTQNITGGTTVTASLSTDGTSTLNAKVPASASPAALTLDTCCAMTVIPAALVSDGLTLEIQVTPSADQLATVTIHAYSGGKDVTGSLKFQINVNTAVAAAFENMTEVQASSGLLPDLVAKADGKLLPTAFVSDGFLHVSGFPGGTLTLIDNEKSFLDVPADYWGAQEIQFVTARELFVGTGDGNFSPNEAMTRQMLWTVLGRMAGQTLMGADVFETARQWAVSSGVSDGSMPEESITREQLAVMLWRIAGNPAIQADLSGFNDAGSISDYASEAMQWAVSKGILQGYSGALQPLAPATRAQVAAMLERYVKGG